MESAQKKPSDAGDGENGGGAGGGDAINLGQKHVISGLVELQTSKLVAELLQIQTG